MNAYNRLISAGLVTLFLPACSSSVSIELSLFGEDKEQLDSAEELSGNEEAPDFFTDTNQPSPDTEEESTQSPEEDSGVDSPDFTLPTIDVDELDLRSLLETDQRALSAFTMSNVLSAIIQNSEVNQESFESLSLSLGLPNAAHFIHDQFMDSYTTNDQASFDFQHCDDEMNNGQSTLNGYPLECPRLEAEQQGNIDAWQPIALFNRLDIAPMDGRHCGEQRLVMVNDTEIGGGLFFLIFEAQIPNPDPAQGLNGCAPISAFWAGQSSISDPKERGEKLSKAFLSGESPELKIGGFSGFMSAGHFTDGTGQIRSNNFNSFTWSLREHKLSITDAHISSRTVPVSNNLFGGFWSDKGEHANSELCREEILRSVEALSSPNPNDWAFTPDPSCWAAESEISMQNDYILQLSMSDGQLISDIEDLTTESVSAFDIAARAQFAGNCMGCHQSSNFTDLGEGIATPQSLGFVHVSNSLGVCADGSDNCFMVSSALSDVFLPGRLQTLQDYIQAVQVDDIINLRPNLPGKSTIDRTLGGAPTGRAH